MKEVFSEEELVTLRCWNAVTIALLVLPTQKDNGRKFTAADIPGFNEFAIGELGRRWMKAVIDDEAGFELAHSITAPIKACLGVKVVPHVPDGIPRYLSKEEAAGFIETAKRKLDAWDAVKLGDVVHYKSSDTYAEVCPNWVGRTLETWPRGRQPAEIWRRL